MPAVSGASGRATPHGRIAVGSAWEPPDIFITTPESLFLILMSQARGALRHVESVIVDEIHSVAAMKRGPRLVLSLERLDEIPPGSSQRIGLSATVRPMD